MSADGKLYSTPLASPALLQKVDELREKNISQHVPLPQVREDIGIPSSPSSLMTIASSCGRPKFWEIILVRKLDWHSISP